MLKWTHVLSLKVIDYLNLFRFGNLMFFSFAIRERILAMLLRWGMNWCCCNCQACLSVIRNICAKFDGNPFMGGWITRWKGNVWLLGRRTNRHTDKCQTSKFGNCGPLRGNKFDLEKGQRSRSQHGVNWKGLSQGSCMLNINALSVIFRKIWAKLNFLWQIDRGTDE